MALPNRPKPQPRTSPENGERFDDGYRPQGSTRQEVRNDEQYYDSEPPSDYSYDYDAQYPEPRHRNPERSYPNQREPRQANRQYEGYEPREETNRQVRKSDELVIERVSGFYDYEQNNQTVTKGYKFKEHGPVLRGEIVAIDKISGGKYQTDEDRTHSLRFTVRADSGQKYYIYNSSGTFKDFFSEIRPQIGEFMWMEVVVLQDTGKRGEYKGFIYDPDTEDIIRATSHYAVQTPTPVAAGYAQPRPEARHEYETREPRGSHYRSESGNGSGYRPQSYSPPVEREPY